MTTEKIEEKIKDYIQFWGLELTAEQIGKLSTYLQPFSSDETELEHEMICEIRSLTDL